MELHDVYPENGTSTIKYYAWLQEMIEDELLESMGVSLRFKGDKVPSDSINIYYKRDNIWQNEISLI